MTGLYLWRGIGAISLTLVLSTAIVIGEKIARKKAGGALLVWPLLQGAKALLRGLAVLNLGAGIFVVWKTESWTRYFNRLLDRDVSSKACQLSAGYASVTSMLENTWLISLQLLVGAIFFYVASGKTRIGLFENGVLVAPVRFVPWKAIVKFEVAGWSWMRFAKGVLLVLKTESGREKRRFLKLPRNETQRTEILRILNEKIAQSAQPT